jgi:hypothetical protein
MIHGYVLPCASRRFSVRKTLAFSWAVPTKQHALLAGERRQVLLRDLVFPLALFDRHQLDPLGLDEMLDGLDEPLTHRCDHGGGGHAGTELLLDEVDKLRTGLQRRHVGIEIHPVDRFQFEGDVVVEDLSNVFAYHRHGAPGERGPTGHDPKRVYYVGAGFQPCLLPGLLFF